MNKNKQILKHCPNFYKIMNFEYYEDDLLSDKLLRQVQKVKDKALSSNKASIRMENVDNNEEEEIEVVEAMPEE